MHQHMAAGCHASADLRCSAFTGGPDPAGHSPYQLPGLPQAKESFAAGQPPEVRILKHLLTFEDPVELRSALHQAFIPSNAPSVLSAGPEDQLATCGSFATRHSMRVNEYYFFNTLLHLEIALGRTQRALRWPRGPAVHMRFFRVQQYTKNVCTKNLQNFLHIFQMSPGTSSMLDLADDDHQKRGAAAPLRSKCFLSA